MKPEADSVRITCTACSAPITAATRFCANCGAEQPGRDCPHCYGRVVLGVRHCGHCGKAIALLELWVALTNPYSLVVDVFTDASGMEREQQVRPRTVVDPAGAHQVPEATRVLLTAGIEKAIEEGRLVRVSKPTSEADSALSALAETTSSSPTGDWRRDLVHAFGLGGGPAVRQMQDAVAPDSVLGVAAIDEGARLPHDSRTSLPDEPIPGESKW